MSKYKCIKQTDVSGRDLICLQQKDRRISPKCPPYFCASISFSVPFLARCAPHHLSSAPFSLLTWPTLYPSPPQAPYNHTNLPCFSMLDSTLSLCQCIHHHTADPITPSPKALILKLGLSLWPSRVTWVNPSSFPHPQLNVSGIQSCFFSVMISYPHSLWFLLILPCAPFLILQPLHPLHHHYHISLFLLLPPSFNIH